jgi:hypothetical protein
MLPLPCIQYSGLCALHVRLTLEGSVTERRYSVAFLELLELILACIYLVAVS